MKECKEEDTLCSVTGFKREMKSKNEMVWGGVREDFAQDFCARCCDGSLVMLVMLVMGPLLQPSQDLYMYIQN